MQNSRSKLQEVIILLREWDSLGLGISVNYGGRLLDEGIQRTCLNCSSYSAMSLASSSTSWGLSAGAATNSRDGFLQDDQHRNVLDNRGFNVPNELPAQPEERLLEVVVRLGRDLKVLEVFFAVEGDGAGLHFALLFS